MNKEAQQLFKTGQWRTAAEAQQWAATVDVDASDLAAMIDLLVSRTVVADLDRQPVRRAVLHALVLRQPSEVLFRPMAKALRVAPADVRALLLELLPRVNSPADHMEVVELLRAPEGDVRAAAARVLIDVGAKPAIAALSGLILERGFAGVREGLEVVVRLSGGLSISLLERLLTRPDNTERLLAIRWLGDAHHMGRGVPAAMRALHPLLRDTHESIAIAAAIAIGQIASEDDYHAILVPLIEGKNLKIAGTIIEGLKRFPSERTAEVLERKLVSGPNVLRVACLSAVENAATAQLKAGVVVDIDPLIGVVVGAMGHAQIAVRNRAAEVMGMLSKSERVEVGRTVVWLLRSGDVNTRRMAAEVLKNIKDPHGELWPKLISSLRDDDWWVREAVMDALLELAGRGLSRYMVAWLADPSDVVRRFALAVLSRLKDPETIAAVVHTARTDPDWWAREKAVEVISEFKDPRAAPILVDIMMHAPELQMACIAGLRVINPAAAKMHLLPLISSVDADVRLLVLKFIEELNDPAHQHLVEPMLKDPDPSVQRLAHALIVRWRLVKSQSLLDHGVVPPPMVSSVVDADERPLDQLLVRLFEAGGDDLIIAPDRPVFMKRHGQIEAMTEHPLSADRVATLLTPLVSAAMAVKLDQKKDVDFSTTVKATGQRLRANFFRQRGGLSAVFRAIRAQIPVLEDLDLPQQVMDFATMRTGLLLVGGATSSGKSTTLAAFIDYINRTQPRHIISLEDPVEIVHGHRQALVQQRELGTHTKTFARALKSALREDPDVIVIGELRDKETIELALTAAETGHLVVGTLHTVSADACIDRIINSFGKSQQDQARASLADSLRAVLCQTLVRRKQGIEGPRLLASELLINNDAVANLIRKAKTVQIPSIIATSREQGMQALDTDLVRLIKTGLVDEIDVLAKARNKATIEAALTEARANTTGTGKFAIPARTTP